MRTAPMVSDPYRNLAEILEAALSMVPYYAGRMRDVPDSLKSATEILAQAIADLRARAAPESATNLNDILDRLDLL